MKQTKQNGLLVLALILFIGIVGAGILTCEKQSIPQSEFTNIIIKNSSKQDSVLVWVTLQAPNSVIGLFGITDTIGSCSKGTFYAYKDSSYTSDLSGPLEGVVISFVGDNLPCQQSIPLGFETGINIFECSINVPYEVFDISCEDGVNSIIRSTVSDTINWTTGDSIYEQVFDTAVNKIDLAANLNIRGVFPYRCTDCIDLGKSIPQNCFNLKDTCNSFRACQVARTNNNGGTISIEYLGSLQICK